MIVRIRLVPDLATETIGSGGGNTQTTARKKRITFAHTVLKYLQVVDTKIGPLSSRRWSYHLANYFNEFRDDRDTSPLFRAYFEFLWDIFIDKPRDKPVDIEIKNNLRESFRASFIKYVARKERFNFLNIQGPALIFLFLKELKYKLDQAKEENRDTEKLIQTMNLRIKAIASQCGLTPIVVV